ncbi:MAG TPA: CYTH domain-containing protein [Longimicrobiaceae bacterium]|nr:CYTH domain-containing protein [Longimicrobiaceae bacterium]
MAGAEREVEAKLIVVSERPREVVERVAALGSLAGRRLVDRGEQRLRDVYHDTPGGELVRRRAAVRLRHGDGGVRLTLKAEGRAVRAGTADRLEVEAAWSAAALERVAAALEGLGVGLPRPASADGEPGEVLARMGLVVVQDRVTVRRVRDVLPPGAGGGAPLAELVVDSVGYVGGRAWHHEVEVEARGEEGAAALEELEDALAGLFAGELRAWPHSKQATGKAVEALLAGPGGEGLVGPGGDLVPAAYERIDAYLGGR